MAGALCVQEFIGTFSPVCSSESVPGFYLGGHIIHFSPIFGKAGHAAHLKIIPAPLSLPVTVSNAAFPA